MNNSVELATPIELIEVAPYNPLISKCQIKVCWVGDELNRNMSIITKEVARDLANSLPGSPIVGYWNEQTEDFEQHNNVIEIRDGKFQLRPDTQPYGFIDLNAKAWFQKFLDNGIEREYLVTEGWLWTGQYPECQRVIDKGNNQSMELDESSVVAHWTKDKNGNREFFIINEAIISKLCILGEYYEPCFEGANITAPKIEFSLEDSFKQQLFSMMTEIQNMLNEGGTSVENELINIEFADKEEEKEICPKCGKPLDECECEKDAAKDKDEDKPAKYTLEEIPEYIELRNEYSALEEKIKELEAQNAELITFKLVIERKEKEAMIDKFYMLSDVLKKEVVDKIDEYSLDDIEAKLSVLCVRNKVSFAELDENKEENAPVTYSLSTEDCSDNDAAPEWVKAIRNTVAAIN